MSELWPTLLPVLRSVYMPPPADPIWVWAEKTLRLASSQNAEHAGQPWRIERVPHTRLVFDFFADPTARELHIMKSSAAAFSTALLVGICWFLRYKPMRVLYCINSMAEVRKVSRAIFQPFLRQIFGEAVVDDPDQSALFFELPNGSIIEFGSPTEGFFANKQAQIVILDEFDLFPDQLEGGVSEPLAAARGRFKSSERFAKLVTLTAPQRAFDAARRDSFQPGTKQHRAFLSGNQMEFRIPCPHCQMEWAPKREHMHFEHLRVTVPQEELPLEGVPAKEAGYDMPRIQREAALLCPFCQGQILEGSGPAGKAAAVRRGKWVATRLDAPPDRWSATYNDTCALLGNSRLGTLAAEMIDAKSRGRMDLVQVCRARFAEPESDEDVVDLSADHVRRHCGGYRRGTCPVVPWFIALIIDCQKGPSEAQPILFKWVLVAYQDDGTGYVVDYGQTASPAELRLRYESPVPYSGAVPVQLPVQNSDTKETGPVNFFCQRAVIDSGYRAGADADQEESFEHHVYPLCIAWGWRADGHWKQSPAGVALYTGTWHLVPMKGRSRSQIRDEAHQFSSTTVPHPQIGQIELPLHLFNDWWFKSELYQGSLAADPRNPADPRWRRYPRIHLPMPEDDLDEQFLSEISAERLGDKPKKVRGRVMMIRDWIVPSKRKNDFGDCLKMGRVLWSLMAKTEREP